MESNNVAVFGWYGHGNLGDEAFKLAFEELLPDCTFSFFDALPKDINKYKALLIGGGSFLDQALNFPKLTIPHAFVGVGVGQHIHSSNVPLLSNAAMVVTRNKSMFGSHASDLVFSRTLPKIPKAENHILVLLNNHLMSGGTQDWQILSEIWFVREFAKACDVLVEKYRKDIVFYPMCLNAQQDDRKAAAAIIDKMQYKNKAKVVWHLEQPNEQEFMTLIAQSKFVVSQRYHGLIFSTMLGKPFIAIEGHDKLIDYCDELQWPARQSYYGFTVKDFKKNISLLDDKQLLITLKSQTAKAKEEWKNISDTLALKLFGSGKDSLKVRT